MVEKQNNNFKKPCRDERFDDFILQVEAKRTYSFILFHNYGELVTETDGSLNRLLAAGVYTRSNQFYFCKPDKNEYN